MSKAAAADDGDSSDGTSSGGGGDDIDGGVFLLQPQRCAPLNKYNGGDGREEAPRGQIVGGIKRERCVEGRRLRAMGGGGGGRRGVSGSGGGGGGYGIIILLSF